MKKDGDIDNILRAFQSLLAGKSGVQVSNFDSMLAQNEKSSPGQLDGSNNGRIADSRLSDSFIVYTTGREQGLALAKELSESAREALGILSGAQRAELLQTHKADRIARHNQLMVRRLKRLVADPLAVKNLRVKAGAVDGFVAALTAGTANTVPPK